MRNSPNYQTLTCENCRNPFVWSQEEQMLYKERGLPPPTYCPICRGIMEAESRDTNRAKYKGSN